MGNFCLGVIAGVGMLWAIVLFADPHGIGVHQVRAEAIEHGHAEWVVTGPDGSTEFRWKDTQQEGQGSGHE